MSMRFRPSGLFGAVLETLAGSSLLTQSLSGQFHGAPFTIAAGVFGTVLLLAGILGLIGLVHHRRSKGYWRL